MYIPRRYQEIDAATIEAFIRANDFAALVSFDGERPVATHVLLELERREDGALRLNGHMARANPQWRTFKPDQDVLAIFAGPHTYVSPRWYNHTNVPTWNYMMAHVTGRPRVITEPAELFALLKRLVDRHEAGSGAVPEYQMETLPADFVTQQMQAIVGFQIEVARVEASFKLSQNRDAESYDNVVRELGRQTDDNAQAVAAEMQARRGRLFGEP